MARKIFFFLVIAFLCLSLFIAQPQKSYASSNEDLTAEKLVAAHVKSIGSPVLLSKIQSLTFVGTSDVKFIQGMNGTMKGTAMFVSQGPKLGIVLKFQDINYPGEYFAYDGKDVTVGHMSPGQKSPIADFVYRFNGIMKEGMLGGILSGAWPLLDIQKRHVDMKCKKTKVDGRDLLDLEYHPKEGFGNMKIHMFFDPTTFAHVRTEYRVRTRDDATINNQATIDPYADKATINATNSRGDMAIGQTREDSIYTLVEKFEDFKKVGGLMLPHSYLLEYSLEGSGHAFIGHWTMNVGKWAFNAQNLDQKIFQAQK